MSREMESNLWKQMRSHLPSNMIATRIENRVGGGIPDVHLLWDGLPFLDGIKNNKNNTIKISPQQIAWNYKYSINGGLNFFLVKHLFWSDLFLFRGDTRFEALEIKDFATWPRFIPCDLATLLLSLRLCDL